MTHRKQQKSFVIFLVLHWAMGVIYDFYYIQGPGVLENTK